MAAHPSELHRFLFEGLPVRGAIVRLTESWQEVLKRRAANNAGPYPLPVRHLLGEMAAASLLMQSNIKFNGALILQIMGDGPVKLAVAEAQANLHFRCTATLHGDVADDAKLPDMVNLHNEGRCAITLDPQSRLPGQQPYQGVVPLFDDARKPIHSLQHVLEHYMLQSEQLDTCLVLAANDDVAAGILIQRLPTEGEKNLGTVEEGIGKSEDFNRIAILASSITPDELFSLPALEVLHRLFWEEKLLRHEPQSGTQSEGNGPRFACTCSRERVSSMIRSLGTQEAESIIAERNEIDVACEFCGQQYRYDAVDAAQIFIASGQQQPPSPALQ